jgi:ABC-type multidrug transport system fused ATPase/permease subunit
LTLNLRKEWFSKILNLELGWHDEISNAPGVLTSKLGGDINLLNIFVSRFLIIFIQSLSSLITGIIIGLWTSCELWICSAFSYPILILSAYLY